MKKMIKSIIAIVLALGMVLGMATVVSAASEIEEEYLSDMRLVYADSYNEAKMIVSESKFHDYKVLDRNLNANSGEIGVWLAYKTTKSIEEAITDVAVMQMGGGYKAGNYQQLINSTRTEYLNMGEIYLEAIEYFAGAYADGDFLAEAAYRQLNFYAGVDDCETDPLGDVFVDEYLSASDLAELFFEGNRHVLDNIRALLAMGVSYNKDGKHYLEKVEESASKMNADLSVFKKKGYEDVAEIIAYNMEAFRNMLEELSAYESELNYMDEELTDLELKYSENMALADMMRSVEYLGGKTLYEFCMSYTVNTKDYSSIYPLVDALNYGQRAMTMLSRYYDVIRYSMTETPEELINDEITKLEGIYGEGSIDVYYGVDRTMYEDTFALTNRAYRTDAYSDNNKLSEVLIGDSSWMLLNTKLSSGSVNAGLSLWTISIKSKKVSTQTAIVNSAKAATKYGKILGEVINGLSGKTVNPVAVLDAFGLKRTVYNTVYNVINDVDKNLLDTDATLKEMQETLMNMMLSEAIKVTKEAQAACKLLSEAVGEADGAAVAGASAGSKAASGLASLLKNGMYISGTITATTNAITAFKRVYDHYHPKYDDIPTAMVDYVSNSDGGRYVKYNVVYEVKAQRDGGYAPADLNAFEGERWNALYYTKSAHAGKPLVADFQFSDNDNRASEGYSAVHRFDEVICYDLNKYNFSYKSDVIFWSIEQSDIAKIGDVDAPNVVGAIFGTGYIVISGVVGACVGIVGTIYTHNYLNKKRNDRVDDDTNDAA